MPNPSPSGLVNCKILVGGSELSGEYAIYSVEVKKETNRISSELSI